MGGVCFSKRFYKSTTCAFLKRFRKAQWVVGRDVRGEAITPPGTEKMIHARHGFFGSRGIRVPVACGPFARFPPCSLGVSSGECRCGGAHGAATAKSARLGTGAWRVVILANRDSWTKKITTHHAALRGES